MLAALMGGALSDPEALPWDLVDDVLQRTTFEFDVETLYLYLVTQEFVLAAVTDQGLRADPLDQAVAEILSDLRQFV